MRILKIFFKVLTGIILMLLLIDISIRIIWKITSYNTGDYGYGLYVNDKIRGFQHNINYQYKLKKAKIKTKNIGNRNRIEYNTNKIPVYVLGDSQVDNFVPDNELFTYLLNENLKKYYFYNFGVAAYSTLQELLSLKVYNVPKNSQVLLIFYLGNDLKKLLDYPETVPGLLKKGFSFIIKYPNKKVIPSIVNHDPIVNLLYFIRLKKLFHNHNLSVLKQGKEEYNYFKNNSKQLLNAFERYEFLIKKYKKRYKIDIIILGNIFMSQGKSTEKRFFYNMSNKLMNINKNMGCKSIKIILPLDCWDSTYHLNKKGNYLLYKKIWEYYYGNNK